MPVFDRSAGPIQVRTPLPRTDLGQAALLRHYQVLGSCAGTPALWIQFSSFVRSGRTCWATKSALLGNKVGGRTPEGTARGRAIDEGRAVR